MLSHIFVEVQKQKKHKSLEKQMQEKTECILDPPYDQIREGSQKDTEQIQLVLQEP